MRMVEGVAGHVHGSCSEAAGTQHGLARVNPLGIVESGKGGFGGFPNLDLEVPVSW